MSECQTTRQKRTDHNDWNDDVDLIDAETIRSLEDEPGDGCRFAAVAKRATRLGPSYGAINFPTTTVLYVDDSGTYGFGREFFGHRPDWNEIPRTMAVDGDADVPELPTKRQRAVAPILERYRRVLGGE